MTAGTVKQWVTPCSAMASSMDSAVRLRRKTRVAPVMVANRMPMSARWNMGAAWKLTPLSSKGIDISRLAAMVCMLPWLSITPLGRPVVPPV
ncbi:hypothetical protein D3C75_1067940 [compost metagenome]